MALQAITQSWLGLGDGVDVKPLGCGLCSPVTHLDVWPALYGSTGIFPGGLEPAQIRDLHRELEDRNVCCFTNSTSKSFFFFFKNVCSEEG